MAKKEKTEKGESGRTAKVIMLTALADMELNQRFACGDEYHCDAETAARLIERGMAKAVK